MAKQGQKTTCIGLARWQTTKSLEAKKPLVCRLCKGETPRKVHSFNEGITPGRCNAPKCKTKQKIKEGDDFLICTRCAKHYHKKKACSEMYRKEVEKLDRTRWECPISGEEEERDNPEIEEVETQFKDTKARETTLKLLQLNIDSITSKVEELKQFIKKHDIDVFLIQETKLTKKDATPKFPGYTIERKDRSQPKGK